MGAASFIGAFNPSNVLAHSANSKSSPPSRRGDGPLETLSDDLSPYTGVWDEARLRHLLRRTMFGVPESQFLAAEQLGSMNAVVTKLLACQDTTKVPLPAKLASWVDNYPQSGLSQTDQMSQTRLMAMERQEIENWWFDQIVQENLSIRQKMTLMWTNHFVTGSATVIIPGYIYYYLMTCMANALGSFKDFASAIAASSAMLAYLNGDENYVRNNKSFVNENFARELMELFTMGISFPGTSIPNYTQDDIENSARALTGWQHGNEVSGKVVEIAPFTGVLWDGSNGNPSWHDTTNKTFLGQTGNWGLPEILSIIFQQPTTSPLSPVGGPSGFPQGYTAAYWACQKLYKEFVYYVPNASVVDAMARLMLTNNFEIASVMQVLLTSDHFYDVNVIGAQIKSPVGYMGSLVREFGLTYPAFNPIDPPVKSVDGNGVNTYTDTNPALSYITTNILNVSQGQELLNPPNVAGWPGGENWLSAGSFQGRQTYSNSILQGKSVLTFSASTYADQIANAGTITEAELFSDLENVSLAFTLGTIESGGLAPNPSKTDDVIGTQVPSFGPALAQLPEFQLY